MLKQTNPSKAKTPILYQLLETGTIFVENSEFLGVASDGTVVRFGDRTDSERIERYLTANPTPDKW